MSRPDLSIEAPARSRPAVPAGLTGGLIGATCCIGPAVGPMVAFTITYGVGRFVIAGLIERL